jgi:hypothetical protein
LQYISPTRWGFAGLLQAQFPVTDTLPTYNAATGDKTDGTQSHNQTCWILPHFGFGNDNIKPEPFTQADGSKSFYIDATACAASYPNNYWFCVLGLFCTVILFRALTIAILLI